MFDLANSEELANVIEYVNKDKYFRDALLIYFTDGKGIYPKKRPEYKSAFLFMDQEPVDVEIPPWAMRLTLDAEEFR